MTENENQFVTSDACCQGNTYPHLGSRSRSDVSNERLDSVVNSPSFLNGPYKTRRPCGPSSFPPAARSPQVTGQGEMCATLAANTSVALLTCCRISSGQLEQNERKKNNFKTRLSVRVRRHDFNKSEQKMERSKSPAKENQTKEDALAKRYTEKYMHDVDRMKQQLDTWQSAVMHRQPKRAVHFAAPVTALG